MRITDCTRQAAGETLEVLAKVLDSGSDTEITALEHMRLRELRFALMEAELGQHQRDHRSGFIQTANPPVVLGQNTS